jgi:hypothetical protein
MPSEAPASSRDAQKEERFNMMNMVVTLDAGIARFKHLKVEAEHRCNL